MSVHVASHCKLYMYVHVHRLREGGREGQVCQVASSCDARPDLSGTTRLRTHTHTHTHTHTGLTVCLSPESAQTIVWGRWELGHRDGGHHFSFLGIWRGGAARWRRNTGHIVYTASRPQGTASYALGTVTRAVQGTQRMQARLWRAAPLVHTRGHMHTKLGLCVNSANLD